MEANLSPRRRGDDNKSIDRLPDGGKLRAGARSHWEKSQPKIMPYPRRRQRYSAPELSINRLKRGAMNSDTCTTDASHGLDSMAKHCSRRRSPRMGQCDSLVSHGHSKAMLLDPVSGRVSPGDGSPRIPATERTSPDGKWIAFACSTQICLRSAAGGETIRVTGGNCNSYAPPAWELDSSGIVFASDCGRGLGLPALTGRWSRTSRWRPPAPVRQPFPGRMNNPNGPLRHQPPLPREFRQAKWQENEEPKRRLVRQVSHGP